MKAAAGEKRGSVRREPVQGRESRRWNRLNRALTLNFINADMCHRVAFRAFLV
jgi:hypothetical protein